MFTYLEPLNIKGQPSFSPAKWQFPWLYLLFFEFGFIGSASGIMYTFYKGSHTHRKRGRRHDRH